MLQDEDSQATSNVDSGAHADVRAGVGSGGLSGAAPQSVAPQAAASQVAGSQSAAPQSAVSQGASSRLDGRRPDQLRQVSIVPEAVRYAEGSVRIQAGHTVLLCTASVDENLPRWLQNTGRGWVTAEYGMLPRSTHSRMQRSKVTTGGRGQEISRLISRSLRAAVDMEALGPRQIIVDCDVLQADGGTRTYAVTGGYVALALALHFLHKQGRVSQLPLTGAVAAVSVGLQNQHALLDLNYDEDSAIHTDMNFVMNQKHEFVEVQGTAERGSFSINQLQQMLQLASAGCKELLKMQQKVISEFLGDKK